MRSGNSSTESSFIIHTIQLDYLCDLKYKFNTVSIVALTIFSSKHVLIQF